MNQDISLDWYRVFYWTAKTGSLSRAAERLYITQPAVSHTLKLLESKLGGQLFFRTSRGVQLTAEGDELLRHLEIAFRAIESAERLLAERHGLYGGEINIGASDTLCRHYLLPYLERFHREYPGIRIRVTNRTSPETVKLLKDGRIDFGIVSLPAPDPTIEVRESIPLHDCLVAGRTYSHLSGRPFLLSEIRDYPLLLLEPGGTTRQYLDTYAHAHGESLQPELELGSLDLLAEFAKSGFGLAFVIKEYVLDELAAGGLVELSLAPPVPPRRIGIATLKSGSVSAAGKAFIELLLDEKKAVAD